MPKMIDLDVARAYAEERWPSPVVRRCVDILLNECPRVEVPENVRCGQCAHWEPDGTYGIGLDGIKREYGQCGVTQCFHKENHYCGYSARRYDDAAD